MKPSLCRTKKSGQGRRSSLALAVKVFFAFCCCLALFALGQYLNNFCAVVGREFANPILKSDMDQASYKGQEEAKSQSETNAEEWYLILVNKDHSLPGNYEVELTKLANGERVDARIYPALQEMFNAARSQGVYPLVASGYRTAEAQQQLLEEKIAQYKSQGYDYKDAEAKAEAWVTPPGTSEHQLGIAVDINADGIHSTGDEVYEWLDENAHKFGFIRRYPGNKTAITKVMNEPWHYRYVGIEAATEMQKKGLCLEEYLQNMN